MSKRTRNDSLGIYILIIWIALALIVLLGAIVDASATINKDHELTDDQYFELKAIEIKDVRRN